MTRLRASAAVLALAWVAGLVATVVSVGRGVVATPTATLALADLPPVTLGLEVTPLRGALLFLVTGLGALIAGYTARNLIGQARLGRFAALQTTAVLGLAIAVTAVSLPLLLAGWMAASLAFAGLVGHAGTAPARSAARLVRRRLLAGDALLAAAVVATMVLLDTADIAALGDAAATGTAAAVTIVAVLVIAAAAVRSALYPVHRWLPETAVAPSPVSALLHAGLVNAIGVLALLLWPVIIASPAARGLAIALGAATVLVALAEQRVRPDVKGRLASSTSTQMGYVAITVGLGLPGAVLLHVIGHGLWKAGRFLGAGGAVTRAAAEPTHEDASPARGAAVAAGALAGLVVLAVATLPITGLPSLLEGPALLLPLVLATATAATAAYASARRARGSRPVAAAAVAVAALAYVGAVRVAEAVVPGTHAAAWGEPGAGVLLATVVALVGLGALAWWLDGRARAGRLPRLAAAAFRSTVPQHRPRRGATNPASAAVPAVADADRAAALHVARAAADTIAPLWPLTGFVASNPLATLEDLSFAEATATARARTGARTGIDGALLRRALAAGDVTEDGIAAAIHAVAAGPDVPLSGAVRARADLVRALLLADDPEPATAAIAGDARLQSVDARARDLVAVFAARVHGSTAWPSATGTVWGELRACAPAVDRMLGLRGVGERLAALPADGATALATLLAPIDDPEQLAARLLARDPGWPAHLAWRRRVGIDDGSALTDLLTARLALESAWTAAAGAPTSAPTSVTTSPTADPSAERERLVATMLAAADVPAHAVSATALDALNELADAVQASGVEVLRLAAIEESYRGPLLRSLAARAGDLARHDSSLAAPHVGQGGADAQVVACIDVRSERLRRHLEAAGPWETLGAAGFFGLPFRHVGVAGEGSDRLPALLLPTRVVTEQATPAAAPEWLAPDLADGIHALESRPALPFALAEASGWITGPLAALRTVAPASWARMRARADAAAGMPAAGVLGVERDQEHPDGFTHDELVDAAAGFLLSTGITAPAPLVVLLGHGGSAPNNPHAAAYDCGACGGHAGGVNARAMAQVLNDPRVRASLRARGLDVPDSTWFVPAVHDTTRDRVRFLDEVPGSHRALAERLMRDLDGSTDRVAAERLPLLPDADGSPARPRGREGRAADWAQVRPEWGLARNAAIIVGPRSLTTGLDLDGRTFLQSYQPGVDDDGAIVEALMAAPVVVAQWISSQYLFSTLDPERFGAGDKTTHNVLVPEDGRPSPLSAVVTGPRGDLRLGLPWQAVGASAPQAGQWQDLPYHCPQRLLAVICASPERIDAVLERQPGVARVVRGEWIALAAVDPQTGVVSRRRADGVWLPVPAEAVAADAEAMEHADRR